MTKIFFEETWTTVRDNVFSYDPYQVTSAIGSCLLVPVLVNYLFLVFRYHRGHKLEDHTKGQTPPEYPFFIPSIGPLGSIWLDHAGFLRRLSTYAGRLTSNRVNILGTTYYNFQDRETIEKIFKAPTLSSSIEMYGWVNSTLLGAPSKAMTVYYDDNSGPFPQPHPQSNVPSHNRIDYVTHHAIFRGLTGPGLQPMTLRYTRDLSKRMESLNLTREWTEMPDFANFFREMVGTGTLTAVIGPTILRLNPTFVQDMFKFDKMFPSFAPGFPSFLMPRSYSFRDRLTNCFKEWYKYAREHFEESMVDEDGDGDPIWGSSMMRQRQKTLSKVDHHDDETIARVDLGLAWATIGNVVLTSMFSSFHVFKDQELLDRVRQDIQEYLGDQSIHEADPITLVKAIPLLSSVYAETLRLYIKVYSLYRSPHEDVPLGKWILPKGALAVLNSGPSHMDADFWNTKDGEHPVECFWSKRFLIDPSDARSGPVRPELRKPTNEKAVVDKKPYYSTEGCDGAWIPYGGGHSMCPGRFFARNVIIFTTALLATDYDIVIHSEKPKFTKKRYGMGVEDLKDPIPFRIRKRTAEKK